MNPSEPAAPAATPNRLLSLDALRGFDMFWIVGADSLGHAIARLDGGPVADALATQLDHVDWAGFRFYDLIFPLFAFMIGVAIPFSLGRLLQQQDRAAAVKRVFRRAALLYLLGLFYYGGFATPTEHIRYVGVLHRLAFAYLGASLLFLYLKPRGLIAAGAAILLGYWAILAWVPFRDVRLTTASLAALAEAQGKPEIAAALRASRNPSTDPDRRPWEFARETYLATTATTRGHLEPGYNVVNHLDFTVLPGKKWDGFYDPEGLLSNLPAVASALIGVLAGLWLLQPLPIPQTKVARLAAAGAACLAVGFLWGIPFPIIKKLWTSSYVLVAAGWSLLLLAAFYHLIEIRGWRTWAWPFIWIGANPLTIYLASNLINFDAIASRFVGGNIQRSLDSTWTGSGGVLHALVGALLCILLCRFLYQRKLFLRL